MTLTPAPPGIQLGSMVASVARMVPLLVKLADSKSPSASGMRPLMVFVAGAGAGAVVLLKGSISSSANCHPVSVSIKSESRSASAALLKLNPHTSTAHTSTTHAVILTPAGDHRILTMPPRLRLTTQDSNQSSAESIRPHDATFGSCNIRLMQQPGSASIVTKECCCTAGLLRSWPCVRNHRRRNSINLRTQTP